MKVIVKDFLNVRVGKPSVNAPCYQYLAPGSEIEVDGILYTGDFFENSNHWLRDKANNYYWAGGVREDVFTIAGIKKLNQQFNYNKSLKGITDLWRQSNGSGVRVAVIDTGFLITHPDLKENIASFHNATSGTSKADPDGHGTHVAGLIGAFSPTGITGIAPKCKIIAIKIKDDLGSIRGKYLWQALQIVEEQKPDILNISLGLSFNDFTLIKDKLQRIIQSGIHVVAAAGENENLFSDSLISMPANMDEVFAVGAIDSTIFSTGSNVVFSSKIDLLMPFQKLISCSNEAHSFYSMEAGSSMASAIVSGLLALRLSVSPLPGILLRQELINVATRFSTGINLNSDPTIISPKSMLA